MKIRASRQRGFIQGAVLLGLAILAVVIGAFALSNKRGNLNTDLETAKVMSTAIVKVGNDIHDAARRLAQDRDISKMDLALFGSAAGRFGLYDPALGVASEVALPARALSTGTATAMTLDTTNITVESLGAGGVDAVAVAAVLPDVVPEVCRMVNKMVYNDPIDTAPPTITAGNAITKTEGCADIASKLTYYKVLGAMP